MGWIVGEVDLVVFGVGCVGFVEVGWGVYGVVLLLCVFFVVIVVEWCEQVVGDFGCFFEDGVGGVGVDLFGQLWQVLLQGGGVEYVVEQEVYVVQWGVVFRYCIFCW